MDKRRTFIHPSIRIYRTYLKLFQQHGYNAGCTPADFSHNYLMIPGLNTPQPQGRSDIHHSSIAHFGSLSSSLPPYWIRTMCK
jgi:hypothetical protein